MREQHFTPLMLPINEVFSAIKDQPRVRRPKPIQHDIVLLRAKDYCSYHDSKGHKTAHYRSLQWYLKELVRQTFITKYVNTLRQPPEQEMKLYIESPNEIIFVFTQPADGTPIRIPNTFVSMWE